jgi:outer membrane protein OmpA-like peptidoglycan-associated protein
VSETDRHALVTARRAVTRVDQPLDLPATSAGPASVANSANARKSADAASAAAAAASRAAAKQVAALAPTAAAAAAATPGAGNALVPGAAALQRPDPACQRELAQLQQHSPVRFNAGAATLDLGQDDNVDALAKLLQRCAVGRVLVNGLREAAGAPSAQVPSDGADAEGGNKSAPMGSLLLAQRRAQALRAELVGHGVAPGRLQLGAGAREVMGDTPARVELTLAPADRP